MLRYGDIKIGSKVRTRTEFKSSCDIVPKGSIGEVIKKYNGLEIRFENRCEHCHFGDRVRISRVDACDVDLLPDDFKLSIPPSDKSEGILEATL